MKRILFTTLILFVALATYCLASIDPQGKLIFSLGGEVSVLNPILSTDSSSSAVEGVVFSGMVRVNENLEVIPDMADRWTVSKDGKIWTFYLKKNIKWHDGKPFTADDVVFTFNSILNPKVNSVRRGDYIIDGSPIRFSAPDKYTVRAYLSKPFAPFLLHAGMGIIPKHLFKGQDVNTCEYNRKPVGTGPFIFSQWKSGDSLTVMRNPNYYLGSPKLAAIIYRVIPDANARLIALQKGEVDVSDIPPKDYGNLKNNINLNLFDFESLDYTYLGFNLVNPLFSDIRVRQALAYATDKNKLVKIIFKGFASPAFVPSAPISWAHNPDGEKYSYNLEKAKKLMSQAGWVSGSDGIQKKNGITFEFTILLNQGNKEREKAAIILQQQWKKVGVKANIRVMEWSALLQIIESQKLPRKFDALIIGWSLGVDPDSYTIWHSSQYPKGFNMIHYNNPDVDSLLVEGRTTIDKKKRAKIYKEIDKIIAHDQPYLFLWYPKAIVGVNKRVGGLSKPGPAGLFINIHNVFVRR